MQFTPHFVGLTCILVGLVTLIYLAWSWIRQSAASQWRSITGEILESHTTAQSDGWSPHVSYTYVVGGKNYTNDRIYLYPSDDTDERRALNLVALYPARKKITVYYKPSNPNDSVLDRRPSLWRFLFLALFASFFLVAGVAVYRNPGMLS
jgi:hypothetical protein